MNPMLCRTIRMRQQAFPKNFVGISGFALTQRNLILVKDVPSPPGQGIREQGSGCRPEMISQEPVKETAGIP